MLPVLSASEMRDADRRTIEEIGLPGPVLMENAGAAVAAAVGRRFPSARRIVVLCGKGNNGGDGFVAARRLSRLAPEVLMLGRRGEVKGDARVHLGAYERSGGRLAEVPDAEAWLAVRERVLGADLIVDAMLGTGLQNEPAGVIGRAIDDLSRLGAFPPVLAVDLPSGLPSDSGEVGWATVHATCTITFAAPKRGHVMPPACDRVGELEIADVGIPASALLQAAPLFLVEARDAAAAFPPRSPSSHKGDFGHVLVIGGSVGKTGAAALCAVGALRAGAGLVTVATPAPALALLLAALRPEAMTEPLPLTEGGALGREAIERALSLAEARDAVVIGPGLGQGAEVRAFVREMLSRCARPMIVDADGLNAAVPSKGGPSPLRRSAATIVTPHPGEMARLIGSTSAEVQRRRLETARAFAVETGAVTVLKGQRTLVADADGRAAVNATGNPGMATGGTGDVLAGILGALAARGLPAWNAATAGVHLHGRAGDLAAARLGQDAMLAGDVADALPEAIRGVQQGAS